MVYRRRYLGFEKKITKTKRQDKTRQELNIFFTDSVIIASASNEVFNFSLIIETAKIETVRYDLL